MEKFIPYEKMSKKKKKEINKKKRNTWKVNPISRVVPNKKKDKSKDIDNFDEIWYNYYRKLRRKGIWRKKKKLLNPADSNQIGER